MPAESERRELIASRLRAGLAGTSEQDELVIVDAVRADIAAMTQHVRFVDIVPAPSPRLVARLARPLQRILLRLLGPLTFSLSDFAAANVRAIAALQQVAAAQQELIETMREPSEPARRRQLDMFALEERFRGTKETVRERQKRFVPYFVDARTTVVDLGCGRGEFLDLLRAADVDAYGVDNDETMVAHCKSLGLTVVDEDAVAHMEKVPAETLGGVFCAHLIEHMTANMAIRLVDAAFAALAPGAWLVLETPNPQALVALSSFYLDFTHVRPYHPQSVEWLLQNSGFEKVALNFAEPADDQMLPPLPQPEASEFNAKLESLNRFLYGERDFAAVGQKPTS
jgi:SAM-dependent methyltransferase